MERSDFYEDQQLSNSDENLVDSNSDQDQGLSDFDEDQKLSGSDFEEEDISCVCGDENHKNLKKWHQTYVASTSTSAWFPMLENEKFDEAAIEEEVRKLLPQPLVTKGRCWNCQKFLNKWPEIIRFRERYALPLFKDSLEFAAGYRNGCRLCTLFVQCSVERDIPLKVWHKLRKRLNCLKKSTVIYVSVVQTGNHCRLALSWPGLVQTETLHSMQIPVCVYCVKNFDQSQFALGETTNPLAPKVKTQLGLAKKWLDICSETHESCKMTEDCQLPTRLIDVVSTPIRLVLTSTFASKPCYATLSHCWGTVDFLKLQADSLERFMVAIPEDKLTKTFHHAIRITRYLGLRYLWIDSLCIVQNSAADWANESARMTTVYGGSAINIAAAGATDGTKGCFLKPSGFVGKVRSKTTEKEVWDIAPRIFHISVTRSPLASRAWALQERLLSRRTLHFTKTEMIWECRPRRTLHFTHPGVIWECRRCYASESFPKGLPKFEYDAHNKFFLLSTGTWHIIVELYAAAKLTFNKDKLIAISGIAQLAVSCWTMEEGSRVPAIVE